MLHIDVSRRPRAPETTETLELQTSNDGAGWSTQYVIGVAASGGLARAIDNALELARVFAAGARYGGLETRITALGESVSL